MDSVLAAQTDTSQRINSGSMRFFKIVGKPDGRYKENPVFIHSVFRLIHSDIEVWA